MDRHFARGRIFATILLGSLLASNANAGVIVVDWLGAPGAQFTSLQAAIDAAAEGDVLLIRTGNYLPASISNKSLTLQADGGPVLVYDQYFNCAVGLAINNLAAGKRVVVRGVTPQTGYCLWNPTFVSAAVTGHSNAGSIWIDSVGAAAGLGRYEFTNCADVVITNSVLRGSAGAAITAQNSNVYVHASALIGSDGADGFLGYPNPVAGQSGAPAIFVTVGGTVLLADCDLTSGGGGDGYFDTFTNCFPAGTGGPAISLASGNPIVRTVSTTLTVGPVGTPAGSCPPTAQGPATQIQSGTIIEWHGDPGNFSIGSPVRELQSIAMQLEDSAGSSAFVLAAASASAALLPPALGALHLAAPLLVTPVGTIPAGGILILQVPVPALPAGLAGIQIYTQGATCPPASPCTLSPPAAIVVLDSSF